MKTRTAERRSCTVWRVLLLLSAVVVAAVAGCATVPQGSLRESGKPAPELQWPPLPQVPVLVFVKEVRMPIDVGIEKGFWTKVAEFFTGERENRIGKPYGVFADAKERLFVADVKLAEVHLMDPKGGEYRTIGRGVFSTPISVTEDDSEHVYITDSSVGTVFRYNLRDNTLGTLTSFKMLRPTGIAYSPASKLLFVAETGKHRVIAVGLDGVQRFEIGRRGSGAGQFNYPTDLFVDRRGLLYVTDSLNSRIQIFTPDGKFLKAFGDMGDGAGNLARPKGVAVDSAGHVYVCDALQDTMQIFDDSGRLLLEVGENGAEHGQFWMPSGLYIDPEDYVYVADSYNRRIQILRYLRR
jgi:hypothetical protein